MEETSETGKKKQQNRARKLSSQKSSSKKYRRSKQTLFLASDICGTNMLSKI